MPDALSRAQEPDEVEIAGFGEIEDPWYLKMLIEVEKFPAKFQQWRVEEGRLYRHRSDPLLDPVEHPEEKWRLVVPVEHRERVMQDAHCTPSSGHLGIEKTYDRVAREYYWKGVYHDVCTFVRECDSCQRYKGLQTGPQGLMGERIVERPWAVVAVDTMEFPPSKSQHRYLLVFQDFFTRWIEVKPLRKADGKSVARALEELILFRWETPEYLLSDNGKEFDNKFVKGTLEEYGVRHVTTPPYHPQANPVERSNRTLKAMISAFVGADHRNWDLHVHEFRHAVNTAVQSTTKVSPAFLNFGRHPRPVKSLRREVESGKLVERIDPVVWEDRMKRLDALRDLVGRHIDEAREVQRKHYNKGRKEAQFAVGDRVLRKAHHLSDAAKKFNAKLAEKYEGPYEVVEILSPTVYVLGQGGVANRRLAKVHVSRLKRYVPPRAGRQAKAN